MTDPYAESSLPGDGPGTLRLSEVVFGAVVDSRQGNDFVASDLTGSSWKQLLEAQ